MNILREIKAGLMKLTSSSKLLELSATSSAAASWGSSWCHFRSYEDRMCVISFKLEIITVKELVESV